MDSRIVVVANRLPVRWVEDRWETSPGGLVRALVPILEERKGAWVGWGGVAGETIEPFGHAGIEQIPVALSDDDIDDFYFGFCNGTLWPLYHDAIASPDFHRHWWRAYERVNRRYAEAVADVLDPEGVAWVQDYQLQLAPGFIRELIPSAKIGFYLHIPWPPVELFSRLPWRAEILRGLVAADVVAFQTRRSAENFTRCVRRYLGGVPKAQGTIDVGGRTVRVQRAPIGIDVDEFNQLAVSPEIQDRATRLREDLGKPERLILGVDRLDYTKGIDVRLKAVDTLLAMSGDQPDRYAFVQVAVPTREEVPAYKDLRERVEGMVGRINGEYARPGWSPVHYLHRSIPLDDLVTYYVAADIMLVTPLRDGMNLVAKEYVACRPDNDGVLILSEFAGAAENMRSALLVNPHDVDQVATTLQNAVEMEPEEIESRMRSLKKTVKREDVYRWARVCLSALEA
ncbi:MAG: trehalose-6-phosphate synthase [Actinomycetota bacterium]